MNTSQQACKINPHARVSVFSNRTLVEQTALRNHIDPELNAVTAYVLEGEGSFSRANLAMQVGISLGLDQVQAESLGASLELFHLASLILDDMPCMDDALLRRSRPCAHVAFGESSTILSSLGLINRAYFLLWNLFAGMEEEGHREAASLVEECLGFSGILDGQAKDIHFAEEVRTADDVLEIARRKTGSLLRLCVGLPAVLAGADLFVKQHLDKLADLWGMIYQISDDMKDIFYGENMSGKTPGRDEVLGRPNLALAIGTEGAMEMLIRFMKDSETLLGYIAELSPGLELELRAFQSKLSTTVQALVDAHVAA